jgi:NTE family protein
LVKNHPKELFILFWPLWNEFCYFQKIEIQFMQKYAMKSRIIPDLNFKMNLFISMLLCFLLFGCTTLEYSQQSRCFHPPLPPHKNVDVALVLGAGGAKGLAHIGVIEELQAAGIHPDLIVGCSAGAIVGALYADRPDINHVKTLLYDKRREHFFEWSIENMPFGVSNAAALQQFLIDHLYSKKFEDLKIPFIAVATSLEFGDLVAFGTGELESPVRASAAIPGVFLPVKVNGGYFVDGGVADPIPVKIARERGAKFIIAVDLSGQLQTSLPKHVFGILQRSLEIHYLHHSRIACHNADYVIQVPFQNVGTFEDGQNEKIYENGRLAARKALPAIKERLKLLKP